MPRPRPMLSVGAGTKPLGRRPKATLPLGSAPPGRPPSIVGKYVLKPIEDSTSGFEMLNTEPETISRVNAQYLKRFELPPALQPKYLRKPEVMEAQRGKAISRGWRKPRSRAG